MKAFLEPGSYKQICEFTLGVIDRHLTERTSARITLGGQQVAIQEIIKTNLNQLFKGEKRRASITSDGNLEVTDKPPPFLETIEGIKKRFQEVKIGDAQSIHNYMSDAETWDDYVTLTSNYLCAEKRKLLQSHNTFTMDEAGQIIRGSAGELLLHHIMQCMLVDEPFDPDEHSVNILDRKRSFILPSFDASATTYAMEFTANLNCKIRENKPFQGHTGRYLIEFDGVLLSGLEPGQSKYSRFYGLDVTSSFEQYCRKVSSKQSQMQKFITAMKGKGIEVKILNILLYRQDQKKHILNRPAQETENSFGVALPLLDTVNEISEMLKSDLAKLIEYLVPSKDRARHSPHSSPPRLPR